MALRERLILINLGAQMLVTGALAADGGAFTLDAGEDRYIRVSAVYRHLHVCNNVGSAGDIVVVIGDHDPIRLAPGICTWSHGDHITVRNDAKGISSGVFQTEGIHQF